MEIHFLMRTSVYTIVLVLIASIFLTPVLVEPVMAWSFPNLEGYHNKIDEFNSPPFASTWDIVTGGGYSSAQIIAYGVANLIAPPTPNQSWVFLIQRFTPPKGNFTLTTRVKGNSLLLGTLGIYTNYDGSLQSILDINEGRQIGVTLEMWGLGEGFRLAHSANDVWRYNQTSFSPEAGKWYELQLIVEESPIKITANIYNDRYGPDPMNGMDYIIHIDNLLGSMSFSDLDFNYSSINAFGIGALGGGGSGDPVSDYSFDWLTVQWPGPTVTISPSSWTMDVGQSKTFTTTLSGNMGGYESYDWSVDSHGVIGANTSTFTFRPTAEGTYSINVGVVDSSGTNDTWLASASCTVSVTVNSALSKPSAHASAGRVTHGQNSTLSVTGLSGGTAPCSYQWLQKAPGASSSSSISGATSNIHNFATSLSTASGNWSFELRVTDSVGTSVTSSPVVVSVVTLLKSTLTTSCNSTAYPGFKIIINGNLTDKGVGVQDVPILLSYSVTGGNSWNDLTLINTDSSGEFSAVWMPSVTGNYIVKAAWNGNSNYSAVSTTVNLVVIPFQDQSIFSVASNSTVSALFFNSTSNVLSFTVSGPSNTRGFVDVAIAKNLVANITSLKISLDGKQLNYTASPTIDSWLLHFTYSHSTHSVTINLGAMVVAEFSLTTVMVTLLVVTAPIMFFLRKGFTFEEKEAKNVRSHNMRSAC